MRGKLKVAAMILAAPLAVLGAGAAKAGVSFPDPVSSCNDVRAYIGADNSMTMGVFKKLLTAAGYDLSTGGDKVLARQCKASLYAKTMTMSQHVLTKAGRHRDSRHDTGDHRRRRLQAHRHIPRRLLGALFSTSRHSRESGNPGRRASSAAPGARLSPG
jgi:hypothetical protein